MLDIKRVLAAKPRKHERQQPNALTTPWGETLDPQHILQEHPRPQFARAGIHVLNGSWNYAITPTPNASEAWRNAAAPTEFQGEILVPFSPEAPLSGVSRQVLPDELLWYRLRFPTPPLSEGDRVLLHFDGVDFACSCYLNETKLGEHKGAYMPFEFDVTDALNIAHRDDERGSAATNRADAPILDDASSPAVKITEAGEPVSTNELLVCVWDPSDTGTQLRGKQRLEASDIWYTAQSGIWKTVWLETVPAHRILHADIAPDFDTQEIVAHVTVNEDASPLLLEWVDEEGNALQNACSQQTQPSPESPDKAYVHTVRLSLDSPRLWSPDDPFLYHLRLTYESDQVTTYCAFRTAEVHPDENGIPRFHLNSEPLLLRGILDQGYWPDGLLTPPSDEALIFDIQSARNLGFNMLRKHIKIESDRWYYHADRLGMLVWQDMPTGGGSYDAWTTSFKPTLFRASWGSYADGKSAHFAKLSSSCPEYRDEWEATCKDMIRQLKQHPSIVSWVLFNEAWGQFHAARMTDMVRTLDPTRPIDAVSGWYDQNCGDYLSVHNYFRPLEVYKDTAREKLIHQNVSGSVPKRAFVISEFGGLTFAAADHVMYGEAYGYEAAESQRFFQEAVHSQIAQVEALQAKGLAGYVYTQLSDVEEEVNGLLTYDRRINKMDQDDHAE